MKIKTNPFGRARAALLALGAAALVLLPAASQAQLVVWSTTNFVDDVVSTNYGAHVDFQGGENVTSSIVTPGEGGGTSKAWEISFNPNGNINFQTTGDPYPAFGNTNTFLTNYTLSFDMQVTGNNLSPSSGVQLSLFENQTGPNGYAVFGPDILLSGKVTTVFTNGVGYQHYAFPLSLFGPNNGGITVATATSFSVGFGYVSYPAGITASPEVIDIANLQITMKTNPPAPPKPIVNVLPANPGLRIFAQNSSATYNQEGFGTVDNNQSWVGSARSGNPVSYSINFADFNTVNGYSLYAQFIPSGGAVNPYVVYFATNALVWTITSQAAGFTSTVTWKTNAPAAGEPNTAVALTSTSTTGRGTWTLTFTDDTDGTVTAPDGTTGSFSLPPEVPPLLGNPMSILFGTAPNNGAGYGQYVDIKSILVTNILGAQESDDFTKDASFNLGVWNPSFSLDAGSVILVPNQTPNFWINWNLPDDGFALETISSLTGGGGVWYSPDYYGAAYNVVNTTPTLMGTSLKWTLVPQACLPTIDGSQGGVTTNSAYFRLSNPGPTQ